MFKWFWRFLTVVGTLALVLYLFSLGWMHFGPQKPQVSVLRKQLADQVINTIADDLRKSKENIQSVVLLHLKNDPTDYLTDQIRATIDQSGVFDLRDRSLDEKIEKALHLPVDSVGDLDAALSRSRGLGSQGVIFGKVHSFESFGGQAKIHLEISLANNNTREIVFTRRYTREISPGLLSGATIQDETKRFSGSQRLLGWLLCVLLLPVFTVNFIRSMVRKESNRANAFTLAVYTATDALLAVLLLGVNLDSLLSILLFLAVIGAAFGYNVFVMTFALKLET